jgi:hypothetical protein
MRTRSACIDEHVRGLQVAMDDAARVERGDAFDELREHIS